MDTPADRIISKFDGVRKLARLLGHANPTTVQGWRDRGVIPPRQVPDILAAAERQGVSLEPEDFILSARQPASEARATA